MTIVPEGEFADDADILDPVDRAKAATEAVKELNYAVEQQQAALRSRREAYTRVFGGMAMPGDKEIVMRDLRRFCRGESTTFDADPRIHALLTGRQEVYRRILDHTLLSFDDMWEKYNQKPESWL